MSFVMLSKIT